MALIMGGGPQSSIFMSGAGGGQNSYRFGGPVSTGTLHSRSSSGGRGGGGAFYTLIISGVTKPTPPVQVSGGLLST